VKFGCATWCPKFISYFEKKNPLGLGLSHYLQILPLNMSFSARGILVISHVTISKWVETLPK